ncbi:hypothetical protein [Cognatiyoonia sp. IB215182]|uniref:hypothetical protein n=1 Tax=Cognatiyoonia sp. IB215182 TaxID=3097353 RepID=UPI002A169FCA|nr:hypothetical protein [Cognatiyoonia sp. IB215182]MDX8352754.1 hypothetical protein [Cognatiyoonia sp. IB215182]
MNGAALSISWLALAIGVVGYILKRWWDNADTIMEHRRRAYGEYFSACYNVARQLMHHPEDASSDAMKVAHDALQDRSPDFLLHASPTALAYQTSFTQDS